MKLFLASYLLTQSTRATVILPKLVNLYEEVLLEWNLEAPNQAVLYWIMETHFPNSEDISETIFPETGKTVEAEFRHLTAVKLWARKKLVSNVSCKGDFSAEFLDCKEDPSLVDMITLSDTYAKGSQIQVDFNLPLELKSADVNEIFEFDGSLGSEVSLQQLDDKSLILTVVNCSGHSYYHKNHMTVRLRTRQANDREILERILEYEEYLTELTRINSFHRGKHNFRFVYPGLYHIKIFSILVDEGFEIEKALQLEQDIMVQETAKTIEIKPHSNELVETPLPVLEALPIEIKTFKFSVGFYAYIVSAHGLMPGDSLRSSLLDQETDFRLLAKTGQTAIVLFPVENQFAKLAIVVDETVKDVTRQILALDTWSFIQISQVKNTLKVHLNGEEVLRWNKEPEKKLELGGSTLMYISNLILSKSRQAWSRTHPEFELYPGKIFEDYSSNKLVSAESIESVRKELLYHAIYSLFGLEILRVFSKINNDEVAIHLTTVPLSELKSYEAIEKSALLGDSTAMFLLSTFLKYELYDTRTEHRFLLESSSLRGSILGTLALLRKYKKVSVPSTYLNFRITNVISNDYVEHNLILQQLDDFFEPMGHGGENDEYISYRKLAASQDDPDALAELGNMYYWGSNGVKRNLSKSYEYHAKASKLGHIGARTAIAKMLLKGEGIEQNLTKGKDMLEELVQYNKEEALNGLGYIYYQENKKKEALEYFERNLQDSDSLFNAAFILFELKTRIADAVKYMEQCVSQYGTFQSRKFLGDIYFLGGAKPVSMNVDKAGHVYGEAPLMGSWVDLLHRATDEYVKGNRYGAFLAFLVSREIGFEVGGLNAAYIATSEQLNLSYPVLARLLNQTSREFESQTNFILGNYAPAGKALKHFMESLYSSGNNEVRQYYYKAKAAQKISSILEETNNYSGSIKYLQLSKTYLKKVSDSSGSNAGKRIKHLIAKEYLINGVLQGKLELTRMARSWTEKLQDLTTWVKNMFQF
eukprot:snap_masked-scaffold_20-processed-gene-5.81-mRNA-1 protein AED:1.00 eAED:1.00 QI:0/-1/0/0/-1/1/1/0/987